MGPIETEFDPTEFPPEYITVETDEPIQSILDRLEAAWDRTPNVVLVIPRDTQAFHTTHDFLAIGKVQGGRDVRVSIASLDPTIGGLARVLGFHMVDPPAGHPVLSEGPGQDGGGGEGRDPEKPTAPLALPPGADAGGWVVSRATSSYPNQSLTTSTWLNNPGDPALYEGAQPQLASQQGARPGMPPPRTRPRQTGQLQTAMITDATLPSAEEVEEKTPAGAIVTPSGRLKARRVVASASAYEERRGFRYGGLARRARWGKWLALAAAVLVVLIAGGSAYAYVYLPEGSVAVTPLNKIITSLPIEVSVLIASSGQGATTTLPPPAESVPSQPVGAPSVRADKIQSPITEEGTRAAGGSRQVPKGKAQGTMRFTNRTGAAVPVPSGAQFKGPNGVMVQTTQGGTVPATVFGQSFGTLDLPIAATADGPNGNLAAGAISGIYGGVLNFYSSALQGGALETIKVVTQEDIDGLAAELRSRAESDAARAVLDKVGSGQQLITQTVSLAGVAFEPDHKAGDDGESVGVKLTAQAQAYVFKESDLRDSVAQAVVDWVQNNLPANAGPSLDLNSIGYTPPLVRAIDGTAGRAIYDTTANARVTFSLTPELARQIRDLVKGKDVRQAGSLITQAYGSYVAPSAIKASVLWFNIDKLPSDPARIDVQPSNGAGAYAPAILPIMDTTPDPRSGP